ncbi:MAG: PIG-L family deacetylase [Acidimicrobiales bacterium]
MSTLVCFHAHPDDESLSTGGLMAKAAAAGHRVILVTATRGEQGEPQPGVLAPGEPLWQRRVQELGRGGRGPGAEPPRFLGYEDSGMMGTPANDNPACFWRADVSEAADRLAAILAEVEADVLTIYDPHGLYGHPDHIQVHRVGRLAGERAGLTHVYEATVGRERAMNGFKAMAAEMEARGLEGSNIDDIPDFGVPEADLAYLVDVSAHTRAKREALARHRSQVSVENGFLSLPDEYYNQMFALEHFALPGVFGNGGPQLVELLPGL